MVPCELLLFVLLAIFSTSAADKPADADAAGSDFFPQYNGFPSFPVQSPVPLPQHDLTALQQTHVLGDFQHRFQQQRFQPPNFQNQPLLFSQQTEFGPPQHNSFNSQRSPPQHVLPPAQTPPPPPIFPQQNQFRPLPPPKPLTFPSQNQFSDARPTFNEQRNQFSEPPREHQPNVFGEPQSTFNNQPNQQFQESFRQQNSFRQQPIAEKIPPFQNAQQQNQPIFQDQNIRAPGPSFFEGQRNPPANNQFNGPRPQPVNNFDQSQRNGPFEQRSPPFVAQAPPRSQSLPEPNNQFINPNPPQQNFVQPNSGFPTTQNNQQFQQNNQQFPPRPTPQQQNNQQFQPRPTFQQPTQNFNQQQEFQLPLNPSNSQNFQQSFPPSKPDAPPVSFNPNRKPAFLPTQIPKTQDETTQFNFNIVHPQKPIQTTEAPKRPLLPLIPADVPNFNEPATDLKNLQRQKPEEPTYFPQYDTQPRVNEISPAPPTPDDVTVSPIRYKPPKPEIKEITINLATTPAPDKRDKSSRKEKTQEELINEQIQKLLQSHNLEVVNKETKPANNQAEDSDLPPLPELPPHLKDKYQIKLVNSDTLKELQASQRKKVEATQAPTLPPLPDLPDHIKKQYDIKLVQKDELFKQFKIGSGGKIVANADLVQPIPGNKGSGNSTQVFLANGQQLEIVNFPKGGEVKDSIAKTTVLVPSTSTTTSKPPNELFEELAKGVIPPGANFELIRHNANGKAEKVKDLAAAKKVTFVLLEEQPDGTVKVQGVKGNSGQEKTENESVDSLIRKIKDGSLKLPPSQSQSILTNEIPRQQQQPSQHKTFVTAAPFTEPPELYAPDQESTFLPTINSFGETANGFTTPATNDFPETTFVPTAPSYITSKKPKSKSRPSFLPTPTYTNYETSTRKFKTSKRPVMRRKPTTTTTTTTTAHYDYEDEDSNQRSSNYNGEGPIPQDVIGQESNLQPSPSLISILQQYGLYEMAKFLDQSGLDTILNETGPYTIFIPTDAAFANLQEQLGGMDKAEDKFKENPRLLSGLLLHHVVPGSFKVSDLQDEMTGVSLAGTQLRVNTYHSERKDSVVTINGAVVSSSKRDIPVPQGLAHAVDRVLFPLPVGDLVQTLKGDRERRFTKFVKSIDASGLSDLLTGTKTYTVFAPTDKAFAALSDAELDKLLTRREAARTIVLRHIMPGTLYSAGMHFFQVKESMERGQKITIQKELGKVKANSAQVVSVNIPSTNGVIHVLDTLL